MADSQQEVYGPPEPAEFDATAYLKSQGLKAAAYNPDGTIIAQDGSGAQRLFNPQKAVAQIAQQNGIDLSQNPVKVSSNTPKTAIQDSPVSLEDRVKLGYGNNAGALDYLGKKYDNVQLDKDSGLVVQEKGVWKQVDPDLFKGDGWSLSNALAKVAEGASKYGNQAVGMMAGGAQGATLGARLSGGNPVAAAATVPIAAIAGAGIGAALGEEYRTRLGRYYGTYKATDEEHMNDLAAEGISGMTGEMLGAGIKPTWEWFKGAVGELGSKASDGVKNLAAGIWGKTSGVGAETMGKFIDNSADVSANMARLKAAGATNAPAMIQAAATAKLKAGQDLLEGATEALPKKYGELLEGIFASADAKGMTVNVGEVVGQAKQALVDSGFGTLDKTGKLVGLTPADLADRLSKGQDISTAAIDPKVFSQVKTLTEQLNAFSRVPTMQGSAAAKALTQLNKTLNRAASQAVGNGTDAELARAMGQAFSGFRQGVASQFEKAGLKDQYSALQGVYQQYGDSVANARQALARNDGGESFINRLMTDSGKNLTAKGEAQKLVELMGGQGDSLYKSMVVNHLSQKMAPLSANVGLFSTAGGISYAAGHPGLAAAAAAAATQSSPRIIAAQVNAAKRGIEMSSAAGKQIQAYGDVLLSGMRRMTPEMVQTALQDPRVYGAAFSQVMNAMQTENQTKDTLLQKAGVQSSGQ